MDRTHYHIKHKHIGYTSSSQLYIESDSLFMSEGLKMLMNSSGKGMLDESHFNQFILVCVTVPSDNASSML